MPQQDIQPLVRHLRQMPPAGPPRRRTLFLQLLPRQFGPTLSNRGALGVDPHHYPRVPDTLSEYQFAGLLHGAKSEVVRCREPRLAGSGECRNRAVRTNKWPGETSREWGKPIAMDKEVKERVDGIWRELRFESFQRSAGNFS